MKQKWRRWVTCLVVVLLCSPGAMAQQAECPLLLPRGWDARHQAPQSWPQITPTRAASARSGSERRRTLYHRADTELSLNRTWAKSLMHALGVTPIEAAYIRHPSVTRHRWSASAAWDCVSSLCPVSAQTLKAPFGASLLVNSFPGWPVGSVFSPFVLSWQWLDFSAPAGSLRWQTCLDLHETLPIASCYGTAQNCKSGCCVSRW